MLKIRNEFGPEERHLRRRQGNPFLPSYTDAEMASRTTAAHRGDQQRAEQFEQEFRRLVEACVTLEPNSESETVLQLKSELDRAAVTAAGLPGERSEQLDAIDRLIALIMSAVRRGAEGDAVAQRELDDEAEARRVNRELLKWPLVADLMLPSSPIPEDELLATLLGSHDDELEAALWLFGPEQVSDLLAETENMVRDVEMSQAMQERLDKVSAKLRLLSESV